MSKEVSSNWKALAPLIKNGSSINLEKKDTEGKSGEVWFDVDEHALRRSQMEIKKVDGQGPTSILDLFPKATSISHAKDAGKFIAMDCEMVGVGPDGVESALARVSLVNFHGGVLLDTYVKPVGKITDYRTHVSGIEPHHLVNASSLTQVQQIVFDMLQGKVLIGHGLKNDFRALLLEHPRRHTRDTSKYRPFRRISRGKTPGLKRLVKHFLGVDIQNGSHDSVDDARAAMLLYKSRKDEWENYLFRGEGKVYKAKSRERKRSDGKENLTLHQ
jgi:RNA exonuclease 4